MRSKACFIEYSGKLKNYLYIYIGGGGTSAFFSIFEFTNWPFSPGLLKNNHQLIVKISMDLLIITQKLLKNYSIFRIML